MPPTVSEFRDLLEAAPLGTIVDEHILAGDSFFFRRTPRAQVTLESHLQAQLGITANQVRLVGSGHAGYSLAPDGFPRTFSRASDLDVVVVSDILFDGLWQTILRWHYGLPGRRMPAASYDAANRIYWGWIAPDRLDVSGLPRSAQIMAVVEHRTRWFNCFQSISRNPIFAARAVKGRLYRTWEHARLYHIDSLRALKEAVVRRE